jgi:hypothetical protein
MRPHIPVPGRSRGARIAAAAVLAVALGATTAPVDAHDGTHDDSGHESTSQQDTSICPPAKEKRLKAAGDRFASACLPGNDFAGLDDRKADLAAGETDGTSNLELIANIPKQGAFASDAALNSDLAFKGNYAFAGNYNGLMVYDISQPRKPQVVTQLVCPGSQNDVSVYGDLLVLSVDSSRSDNSCNSVAQPASEKSSWEGIRVFDISDPAAPRYAAAVETHCGSHTHTLAPTKDGQDLYVYVSSYSPNAAFPDCQPPHDKISVIKVPIASPDDAALVGTPVLFPDGGNPGGNGSSTTSGCHDITAYPSKDIAAGACMGDGILMDISDREHPVVTEQVRDTTNFAFWHSATFNNAGTKVVFTDELGGGGGPTCNPTVGQQKGADGIYDIVDGQLVFKSYFKIPRTQANTENCVAHNGSLIPVPGKDIMVQAWYQGGISVWDFTDSANPKEIAWFDRGPYNEAALTIAGAWSTYYYNGYIYSNEIQRGFDVFDLRDPRTAPAKQVRMDIFNPQSQPSYNG